MTLPRLAAMNRFWRSHPPMHLLMEAFVGFKAPADDRESMRALAARLGQSREGK